MPTKPHPQFYALVDPYRQTYRWMGQLKSAFAKRGISSQRVSQYNIKDKAARIWRNLNLDRPFPGNKSARTPFIVPVTWGRIDRAFPHYLTHPIIPIINDCWEPQFDRWEKMIRQHRFETAFFTARIAGQVLSERVGGIDWVWMPEAIDPSICDPSKDLAQRGVDLAEFGRTVPVVYERCEPMFKQRGYTMRAAPNGQWVVKTPEEFYHLLGDTRLCSCFPKTMTLFEGPQRAGCVETVTFRYFEVMASRALPYGHCPAELEDLFGYNPCIQADLDDPAGQVDDILQHIRDYQQLADRNYQRLLEVGVWDCRVKTVIETLRERGYDVPET
ncbi:MAG: glycosyltransferase [Planctomycetota bacterium]